MPKPTYKYTPADFEKFGLSDELKEFYRLYEIHKASGNRGDWFDLFALWTNSLFFSIKHAKLYGTITENAAISELREYLEELLYDG